MKLFIQKCKWCKKCVYRNRGRINETKKFGWKTYCSSICQSKVLSSKKQFNCARPNCDKTFLRTPHDIRKSIELYCSRSCAVIVNNSKFPKRTAAVFQCAYCHEKFRGRKTYCSRACKYKAQTITDREILKGIRRFYKKYRRIPMKIEFPHYGAAQDRFGSWNKAITAAGFNPNPVKFAKKYLAKDGHNCDSMAEKIIDDWIYERNIKHERNIRYPNSNRLTADFVTKNQWIEFFGLSGELKEYDIQVREKQKLAKRYKLPLVELYPKDLFPVSHLSEKLLN